MNTDKQPEVLCTVEALRLAEILEQTNQMQPNADIESNEVAAELRRLHALNQELLEALKGMVQLDEEEHQRGEGDIDICKEVQDAYSAIAKAQGASNE